LSLSSFGVARNRDLMFTAIAISIAMGKLHVDLAWDIQVITSSKNLNPEDLVELDWILV
jgi:hypothetical protein